MSEIENAKRLLKELLGDYRVRRVGDIYRIAAVRGITKQTLKLAKKRNRDSKQSSL